MTTPRKSPEDKLKAGRPSEYDPAYCERVVELGKEGKSRAEIASALNCSRTTLTAWEAKHPEFLTALSRAKDEELAWWECQAREGLAKGSAFNAAIWKQSVSGRFPGEPYRERVQVAGRDDGPIEHVDLSRLSTEQLAALKAVVGPLVGATDGGGEPEAG